MNLPPDHVKATSRVSKRRVVRLGGSENNDRVLFTFTSDPDRETKQTNLL